MLAIRSARLFDGMADQLRPRPLVLVDQGRITDVDLTGADPPERTELVELGGATLLPGLIDSHSHLVLDASNDPVGHLASTDDDELLEQCRARARAALAAGITTLRDLGDRRFVTLRLREELAAHSEQGPELLVSGPPITTPGGHCWFLGGEAAGVQGVQAAVRALAARGVDVVKVMVTGGNLTPARCCGGRSTARPSWGRPPRRRTGPGWRSPGTPTAPRASPRRSPRGSTASSTGCP